MRIFNYALIPVVILVFLLLHPASAEIQPIGAFQTYYNRYSPLAEVWSPTVLRWSSQITQIAQKYGVDRDLIAAMVEAESNGYPSVESYAGAVGLMGVMPAGPGFEWRPTREELFDPYTNIDWGTAIFTAILRQSGGDVKAALAAYNGGWELTTIEETQAYAARVLNLFGQAVASRSGISPEIASEWTIGIELTRGNIPSELLLLGQQPFSGLHRYGEHLLFWDVQNSEQPLYVKGWALPVGLVVPLEKGIVYGESSRLEPVIMARLGVGEPVKESLVNPHVLLACLPSLERLRGRLSTRWFAPTACPGERYPDPTPTPPPQ